jgi:hypothetical protein
MTIATDCHEKLGPRTVPCRHFRITPAPAISQSFGVLDTPKQGERNGTHSAAYSDPTTPYA